MDGDGRVSSAAGHLTGVPRVTSAAATAGRRSAGARPAAAGRVARGEPPTVAVVIAEAAVSEVLRGEWHARLSRPASIAGPEHRPHCLLRLIRPRQLRWGAADHEVRRTMPGDEIVARPTFNATRAVTVEAPPSLIWPGSCRSASAGAAGTPTTCSITWAPERRARYPRTPTPPGGGSDSGLPGDRSPRGSRAESEGLRGRAVDPVVGRQDSRHDLDLGAVPG
jgi:hypothetical protein